MNDADAADATEENEREEEGVSPAVLTTRLDRGELVTILDVRNRTEIERWAVDGENVTRTEIPFVRFQAARVNDTVADLADGIEFASGDDRDCRSATEPENPTDDPVIVVCGRGEVSDTVADLLAEAGVDARNLVGGMDAWGDLYTATRLDNGDTNATVYQYRRPSSGCLSYLVVSDGEAAVIDPLWAFTDRYEADAAAHDAVLTHAIDTHVHADHLSGLRELGERGVEVLLPAVAAARGVTFDSRTIADGEEMTVGSAALRVVSLPGHTTGMTGLVVGNLLLAGDSVFLDGVARPDLEADSLETGGDGAADVPDETEGTDGTSPKELAGELYETLTTRFARFDDTMIVAPGHHGEETRPNENGTYTARLGDLRERLGAFEAERDAFVERVLGSLGPRPANHERILEANLGADSLDAEEARTLELGPNNCAAGPVASD